MRQRRKEGGKEGRKEGGKELPAAQSLAVTARSAIPGAIGQDIVGFHGADAQKMPKRSRDRQGAVDIGRAAAL
jgi:hypothetical protein